MSGRHPVVVAQGVVKRFGTNAALDGATCTIEPGVTGLLGANGAGKTTLISVILGLRRVDEGSLRVLGEDPAKAGPIVRERIGYAPEHHHLPGDTKALDLVRHIGEIHGLPPSVAKARASDALWQVGLGEERFRPMGTMSTGQRQRVKLAQAIVHDPLLILLDEPTDGLDPVQRDDMLTLIRRVGTDFGIDVVVSSHLLEEVERICDAAVILRDGQVLASGTLDQLRGTTQGCSIVIDGPFEHTDILARELIVAGADVSLDAQRLLVRQGRCQLVLADLVRDRVAANGFSVRRFAPLRVTLEDVFLGLGAAAPPPSGPVDPSALEPMSAMSTPMGATRG